jgi:thiamine-phosphate pyrophosphorylase
MPWLPQGLQRVSEWKRQLGHTPLVAIGGLTAERAPAVLDAGADSLAVVTDVTLNLNPVARVTQWLEITA